MVVSLLSSPTESEPYTMTDLVVEPSAAPQNFEGSGQSLTLMLLPGYYLAPSGDLWELTDEGWYVNGEWSGRENAAHTPDGLQRMLTGNQWGNRIRQLAEDLLKRPLKPREEKLLADATSDLLFEQEPEWAAAARENSERSKNQPEDFEQPSESESFTHPSWLSASSTEQREHDSEEIMAAETSGQQVQLAKDQVAEDKAEEQQTTRWIFRLSRRK